MKTIHHVVEVSVTSGDLFRAITSEEGLSRWWTTNVSAPEPAVGSVIAFNFGSDFNPRMEVVGLEEPSLLEWKCVGGHDPWRDNTFRFEIAESDDGSLLRFWQHYAKELDDDAYGIYNYNLAYYLQSLYELVTTGRGKPFEA